MVRHDHRDSLIAVDLSPKFPECEGGTRKELPGKRPDGEDRLRRDKLDLLVEKGSAGLNLVGQGISVSRRTAFQDVADIGGVSPGKVHRGQEEIQEFSGRPHERPPRLVFLSARSFANHHEPGGRIPI